MENMQNKKEIFKIIHEAVKLTPKVISYSDETESHKIDIYIGEIGQMLVLQHIQLLVCQSIQ